VPESFDEITNKVRDTPGKTEQLAHQEKRVGTENPEPPPAPFNPAPHITNQLPTEDWARLIASAPNGFIMLDDDGVIALVNTHALQLFGYTQEELLGQPVEILLPERYRAGHPGLRGQFLRYPQTRKMGRGRDLVGRRKGGAEFWIEVGLNPLVTKTSMMVLCSILDISARKETEGALRESQDELALEVQQRTAELTLVNATLQHELNERERAELMLRESERRLSFFLSASHTCGWELDLGTLKMHLTTQFSRLFGYGDTLPDWDYDVFLSHVLPEDREAVETSFQKSITMHSDWDLEYRIRRADGEIRWVWTAGGYSEQSPSTLAGIVQDITARKLDNAKTEENQERLALATISNGVGIWDWNLVTLELMWDNSMFALYNMERANFSSAVDAWETSLHPDDLERCLQEVQDAISGVKSLDTDFRVVWSNGEVHHIKAVAKTFFDDSGKALRMLGTNIDITARKSAEDGLHASYAEREVLMHEIHHRVKNNLQMMSALLELQAGYVQDAQVRAYFTNSQQRIQSMAMIHAQLYQNNDLAHIDFNIYLRSLVESLRVQYIELYVDIKIDAETMIIPVDVAIPLGLVVNELVTNAMKHAFPRGQTGDLLIRLLYDDEGKILLEVADNGVGLPAKLSHGDGKSFGMRIVRLMIEEQLDGTLRVESDDGLRVVCEIGARE
jgi:PAS domain S-box-containing protein